MSPLLRAYTRTLWWPRCHACRRTQLLRFDIEVLLKQKAA